MLRLEPIDKNYRSFWIVDDNFSIGSSAKNEMQLSYKNILPTHALLKKTNNSVYIEAFSDEAIVRVNNQRISSSVQIEVGDIITLDTIDFKLVDLSSTRDLAPKKNTTTPTATSKYDKELTQDHPTWKIQSVTPGIIKEVITIDVSKDVKLGRDETNDIVVPRTHVSRRHAEFFINNGQLIVRDFNSANGTFVNDEKIIERAVYLGDEIRFDTVVYNVIEGTVASLNEDINPDQTQFRAAITTDDLKSFKQKEDSLAEIEECTNITSSNIETITQNSMSAVNITITDNDKLPPKDVENHTPHSSALNQYNNEEDAISNTYFLIAKTLVLLIILVIIAFLVLYYKGQIQFT